MNMPMVWTGLLMCILGLGTLAFYSVVRMLRPHLVQPNSYTYTLESDEKLLTLARSDDVDALAELRNRVWVDRISDDLVLPDIALSQCFGPDASQHRKTWAELLGLLADKDRLTPEQLDNYCEQMICVEFEVRPVVRRGDPLAIMLNIERRTSNLFMLGLFQKVHGIPLPKSLSRGANRWLPCSTNPDRPVRRNLYPYRWTEETDEHFPVGTTRLEGSCELVVSADPSPYAERSQPLWSKTFPLSGEVTVLPENAPDPVMLVEDEQLGHVLAAGISNTYARQFEPSSGNGVSYSLRFELDEPASLDLAFEVIGVVDGSEFCLGTACWPTGSMGEAQEWYVRECVAEDLPKVDYMDIILRSNPEVARRTAACFNIWDGQVNLGNVQISKQGYSARK